MGLAGKPIRVHEILSLHITCTIDALVTLKLFSDSLSRPSSAEKWVFGSGIGDYEQPALYQSELAAIRAKCLEFGISSFMGSSLHEEQERELQPENEREQQVEHPSPVLPHPHSIHPSLTEFVVKGEIPNAS